MNPWIALAAAAAGYLIGSISFARIVARLVAPGEDITHVGMPIATSGETHTLTSVGGTAVGLKLGPKWGGATALLDIAKVAIPALAFRLAFPGQLYHLIVALTGLVGHVWPIYYRFRGGGGMSAIYGGALVVDWVGALVTAFAGMFLGLALRSFLLVFMGGILLLIPWMALRWGDWPHILYAVAVNVIFALAMIPEARPTLERMRRGEKIDFETGMGTTPMGRMMMKMMKRRGPKATKGEP
jgi:glycerol-3-phosphate acyltransferase PlsY